MNKDEYQRRNDLEVEMKQSHDRVLRMLGFNPDDYTIRVDYVVAEDAAVVTSFTFCGSNLPRLIEILDESLTRCLTSQD